MNWITPSRQLRTIAGMMLLIVSLSSCRKDTEGPEKEDLPVFGTCAPVPETGNLTLETSKKFTYITKGGGNIHVDLDNVIKISHNDYKNFKVEFWGDTEEGKNTAGSHENLNGKHMKDWKGSRRSVVFPDGAKVTFISSGYTRPILSIAIYEGSEVHFFNAGCHKLEYSTTSSPFTRQLDDREADGETSTFEFTETGLIWKNLYLEDTPENKVTDEYPIGELHQNNPNQVNDFYDDPRMGHT